MDAMWHRRAVGGLWHEIGGLQFAYLVEKGLKPDHYLLDVGCGSLRGGVHFVRYLAPGHYYGVDKEQPLLDAGRDIELGSETVAEKRPTLLAMDDFNFARLGQTFEVALAQSLFTHLVLNSIVRCLSNVEKVLKPRGRFYATFFENPFGKANIDPITHEPGGHVSYLDRDPFHYDFATFQWLCEGTRLNVDYIGDWGHPRDQKIMVFTRTANSWEI